MARAKALSRYRSKRDFAKTKEPRDVLGKKGGHHYLIQKHDATRLHYDFRLELDGVLKSWAVTRGPSLDPADKRLAVEVEDHPVAYGSFEGIIPKGQYGGGIVMLWDEGDWEPIGDPQEGLRKGKLPFRLHGKRLRGEWALVRMRTAKEKRNNWLLIKKDDDAARPGNHDRLLATEVRSIKTGRRMEEIAKGKSKVWQSKAKEAATPAAKPETPLKKPAKKSRMPVFIPPELATLSDKMPAGDGWVHEIKFDGYRMQAHINNGKVMLFTRTGKDWTHKFSDLAGALAKLPVEAAILDGEAVALDADGASSFKLLQQTLSDEANAPLQYYVFDLLHLNGESLLALSLQNRKELLKTLLAKPHGPVLYSEHFAKQDEHFLQHACSLHLEGVVSKQIDAPYHSGRNMAWLKTKCHQRQEFVIGGYTVLSNGAYGIGALLLGYYEKGKLRYAGRVGTGFGTKLSQDIREKLEKMEQKAMPFDSVTADGKRGGHWVKPMLVCEVEFSEWTHDGHLRHPSFQGFREDKPAESIKRELPVAPPAAGKKGKSVPAPKPDKEKAANATETVSGIKVSHAGRIIYPGEDITKLELAQYYERVAEHILPHIKGRPLSMMRCPEGIGSECFFQRHIAHGQSPHWHEIKVKVKDKTVPYLTVGDEKGLLSLIQWGVIELHPWGCLADKPDLPDRMVFDLDPAPDVPWKHMLESAREIRERMREFGLEAFLKTTGGKGLHVVVPMIRKYGWNVIKPFARAVAESLAHDTPDRYIATASKAKRKGLIFVDYLRNELTATSVAPFSARAREGAYVATPLDWKELTPSLTPSAFTIETVPPRLEKRKADPWQDFFKVRQQIAAKHLKALKLL